MSENSAIRKFLITAADGKKYNTNHYNLEAIIALGYRINSQLATEFRKWAEDICQSAEGSKQGIEDSGKLPEGWINCCIRDILSIQNGYAFKTKDFKTQGVPLVKQTNLIKNSINLEKCQYLDKSFLLEKCNFILENGDILIGMSGSLGKVSVYKNEFPALQNHRTGKLVFHTNNFFSKSLFLK